MRKPHEYSIIRKEPANKPPSDGNITAFYDLLIKPHTLMITTAAYFALVSNTIWDRLGSAVDGNLESILLIAIHLFTLLLGARLIQSLILARRDYPHLKHKPIDLVIFAAVLLFTSGIVIRQCEGSHVTILVIYAWFSFVGALNFYHLYKHRIPKNSGNFDYPFELRIQRFNFLAFLAIGSLLILSAQLVSGFENLLWGAIVVGLSCPIILINIFHSGQLSYRPKFLLHNEPDETKNLLSLFKSFFGPFCAVQEDDKIKAFLSADATRAHRSLKIVRAKKKHVSLLSETLASEFRYVFSYVFGTDDRSRIEPALSELITTSGGFGDFGFHSFYIIMAKKDQEDWEAVGFLKADTLHPNWIYQILDMVTMPFILRRHFGMRRLAGIVRRTVELVKHQGISTPTEVRLAYLVIFNEHRKKGYGLSVLTLLKNALRSTTNDIVADRVTTFVRSKNKASVALFQKAGFTVIEPEFSFDDPLGPSKVGSPTFLEWKIEPQYCLV